MARLRNPELIVKTSQEHGAFIFCLVQKNAEKFFVERVFLYAVMVIKPRLCAPADMESACDVGLAPFHYAAEFVPIFNLFKRHLFNRRARYYQAVVLVVLNIFKMLVKRNHVFRRRVFGCVRSGLQKLHINLKRRVAEQTRKLRFRGYLGRHKVEKKYFKRTYILRCGAGLGHNKDIFFMQRFGCGQVCGNFYRHFSTSSSACFISAIISSTFSIPTDIRIMSGPIPQATSCSSESCLCVVEAG